MLNVLGHDVRHVVSGNAALEVVQRWTPDVVICDIGLPEMDGYEVCRRLRQVETLTQTKFIALSGYGQQTDVQRSTEAGFELHLTKPIAPTLLEKLVSG